MSNPLGRVPLEYARLLVDRIDPHTAVLLACDLLVAGIDDEAVVALATGPPGELSQAGAERHLEAVVQALGIPEPDAAAAVALVAADVCRRILDGTLPAERGAHALLVVGHDGSGLNDLTDQVLALTARLENDLGGTADDAFRIRLADVARALRDRLGPTYR